MIWTTSFLSLLVALLSMTPVNAFPSSAPSASFYSYLFTSFIRNIELTNCPFGNGIALPPSTLPAPSEGLTLKYITLGRGTQNYTCAANPSSNTTTPEATGATATLFDASCLAALGTDDSPENQSILHILPDVLKPIPLSSADLVSNILSRSVGQNLAIGKHYFTADGVPFFDLRGPKRSASNWIASQKVDDMDAPAQPGYGITGNVPWLKLNGIDGGLSEVYRVHTAGGSPPATCEDMPEEFTVDYSSEYWFYG